MTYSEMLDALKNLFNEDWYKLTDDDIHKSFYEGVMMCAIHDNIVGEDFSILSELNDGSELSTGIVTLGQSKYSIIVKKCNNGFDVIINYKEFERKIHYSENEMCKFTECLKQATETLEIYYQLKIRLG